MAMFSRSLGKSKSAIILHQVCARNLRIELHKNISKHELFVAKSRFLACDEKHLYIDKPNSDGDDEHVIELGDKVCIFFWHDNDLLKFQSRVVSRYASVLLNEDKKITALSLTRPAELKPLQRRHDYRVKLIGSYDIFINASHCVDADEIRKIDVDNFPELKHCGELVDLSTGGAAIKLLKRGYHKFALGEYFFLQFTLNEGENNEREFIMLSKVCYRRILNIGKAIRLGIHFEPWPSQRIHNKNQEDLQHFITQVQRKRLRVAG